MLSSCKSNEEKLDKLTSNIEEIVEQLDDESSAEATLKLVAKFESLTKHVPSSLLKLNKEEFMALSGSEDFINAVNEYYSTLSTTAIKRGLDEIGGLDNLLNSKEEMPYEEETDYSSSSISSKKWNKILDKYEKMVDKLIPMYKKIAKGDMNVLVDCTKYTESVYSLAEELEDAKSEMSSTQLERFLNITSKLTKAVAGSDLGMGSMSSLFQMIDEIGEMSVDEFPEDDSEDYEDY